MATVTRIDPRALRNNDKKLRTCAYCRVSSNSADQLNSYAAQIRYYTKAIRENPEWDFVDIFADEGITGTRADKRVEFQRMLKLCEHGKIDFIITKSISRFARNVTECLEFARKLKRQGIGIFFEKESINTLRMSDELMLSTFSAIAQEESVAISKRLRHANLERMKRGEYIAGTSPFGYRLVDKKLTVYEPEARTVKDIFNAYLSGSSVNEIARDMNQLQVAKRKDTEWHYITVFYILTNEKYIGDTLFQKTFKTDTLPFEKKKNNGEKDQYYATGSHDPIIDRETFETVQKLLKEKAEYFGSPRPSKSYPLSKRIRCKECGAYFIRRSNKDKVIWSCYNHERDKNNCHAKRYREEDIYKAYMRMFNKLYCYRQTLLRQTLAHIDYVIKYKKRNNPTVKAYNQSVSDLLNKKVMLESLRQKGYMSEEMYYTQCKEIDRLLRDTKADRAILYDSELEDSYSNIKELYEIVESYEKEMTHFDEKLFDKIVVDVYIKKDNTIEFKLMGGLTLTERL